MGVVCDLKSKYTYIKTNKPTDKLMEINVGFFSFETCQIFTNTIFVEIQIYNTTNLIEIIMSLQLKRIIIVYE